MSCFVCYKSASEPCFNIACPRRAGTPTPYATQGQGSDLPPTLTKQKSVPPAAPQPATVETVARFLEWFQDEVRKDDGLWPLPRQGESWRGFIGDAERLLRKLAGAAPQDVEGLSDWRFKLDSEFAVDPDADTVSYKAYARLKAFARQAVGTIEQYRATLAAPDTLASERKAFEQAYAARSDGRVASFKFDRHPSGEYVDTAVDFAWWGWQAALRGRVVGAAAPYPAEATFELGSEKAAPLATGWQPHKGCPRR